MTDAEFQSIYGLTQDEKEQLTVAISEEIVLALDDSNQDDWTEEEETA